MSGSMIQNVCMPNVSIIDMGRIIILNNRLNGSVMIIISDLELDAPEVGEGIMGLKKYMQNIFFLSCYNYNVSAECA